MSFCGQSNEMFSEKDGVPHKSFPNGWKGGNGIYAAGFTKRGLLGASIDARTIAQDIEPRWKAEATSFMAFAPASLQQSYMS